MNMISYSITQKSIVIIAVLFYFYLYEIYICVIYEYDIL